MQWSLLSEYIALILVALLMSFFYDPRQDGFRRIRSQQRMLYWCCLGSTGLAIILNVATVVTIQNADSVSLLANAFLNSLYYCASVLMSLLIGYYLFDRLFEYVYDPRPMRVVRWAFGLVFVAYVALILWNASSGVVFYFDANNDYHHGVLNGIVYLAPLIELAALVGCAIYWRKGLSLAMRKTMVRFPLIVLPLLMLQVAYPEELLNGMISVTSCLIIFLSFQSSQIEIDPHTGIANRQSFSFELDLRIGGRQHCQIILVVLRKFSRVNNLYGSSGGDAVLVQVAKSLRNATGGQGRVFRYSNVGFVMLMPADSEMVQDARLNLVLSRMREDWYLGDNQVPLRFSVVELRYVGQEWTSEEVIGFLDYSARLAKQGKFELVRFDADIVKRYARSEYLLHLLQTAIREGGFTVYYQPIFHCETGRFDSAEALLRLCDADGTPVSPDEFIPVAEDNGLIDDLSWIVLKDACRLLGSGAVPELQTVTVNLSMHQLMQRNLRERLLELLESNGVAPDRLKLEVTERVLAENGSLVRETMEELNESGVAFLLDDFGTGYSNFQSMLEFPFAAIKLDRSLVSGLANDSRSQATADTLIPFFHELGHLVVAEGVEDVEQARCALCYGADFIQGFHYARPMPQEQLAAWYGLNNHCEPADLSMCIIDANHVVVCETRDLEDAAGAGELRADEGGAQPEAGNAAYRGAHAAKPPVSEDGSASGAGAGEGGSASGAGEPEGA